MKLKQLLAAVLSLVMVLGSMGTVAFAEEADSWDGRADKSWYNSAEPKTEYTITTAEQLAGLAELVSGDLTFKGVTFKLANDIDLYCEDTTESADGDPLTFRPIGDHSKDGTFEGVFDGDGHTISNLYQNGWDLGYEWGAYGSYGLFGNVNDAIIKNLKITGSESYIEGGDVAGITGSATGTCVFENITITDSDIATYNNGCGGIIGWSGAGKYTFKNITIAEDVTLAGLWGSFDSSIGGIVGQGEPGATYNFENVNIACRIDAYNDVTASYDYYNYRMCGMIIGRLQETVTIDGRNYPDMTKYNINCTNVTVTYNEWANYHYCRPEGGRGKRVEAGYAYDGIAEDYDHSACTVHHMECMPFEQLFGGAQYGVDGLPEYEGVTIINKALVARSEAKNDDTYYETLEQAFAEAEDDDTIELLSDVEVDTTIIIEDKKITVNGNGYTVEGSDDTEPYGFGVTPFFLKDADVTFEDITIKGGDTSVIGAETLGKALEVENSTVIVSNSTLATGDGTSDDVVAMPVIMADENSDINFEDVTLYQFSSEWATAAMISAEDESGNVLSVEKPVTVSGTLTIADGSSEFAGVPIEVPDGKEVKFIGNIGVEYISDTLYVQFRKADVDDEKADTDEESDLYDIVIIGNSEYINRLNSADLTFKLIAEAANQNAAKPVYEIIATEPVNVTSNADYENRYMFSFDGVTRPDMTDKSIVIGQVKISGYGTYTLGVDAATNKNIVNTAKTADNIVENFYVDGKNNGDGELVIDETASGTIAVPVRNLAINIDFPNAVANQKKAYQDMKVTIVGGTVNETIELGADGEDYNFSRDLPYNTAYTVTVSGAGYRTARYTVTMTEDKTLNFWNNVMDKNTVVEEGKFETTKNFLAGDIVKDNNINIYDLSAVVSYFGTETVVEAASDYAKYDLNRDGVIDSRDVAYVLVSWGE